MTDVWFIVRVTPAGTIVIVVGPLFTEETSDLLAKLRRDDPKENYFVLTGKM